MTASKWVGVACILIGTTLYGIMIAQTLRRRVRQLDEIINALRLLEVEIAHTYTPLPYAFEHVAPDIQQPVRQLLQDVARRLQTPQRLHVADEWQQAVRRWSPKSHLDREELHILLSLGGHLGRTNVDDHIRSLQYVNERLQLRRDHVARDMEKQALLRLYCGVASGVIMTLVLL